MHACLKLEYRPSVIASECWNLMRELMLSFMPASVVDATSTHFKNRSDAVFLPQDTVLQYLEHFNLFRKSMPQQQLQ
jgi:mediator of RNA polymerase II transcription subunit 20